LTIVTSWRLIRTLEVKRIYRRKLCDLQTISLVTTLICAVVGVLTIIDPLPATTQIIPRRVTLIATSISTSALLLGILAGLRLFISIDAGFYPPSKRVLRALDLVTVGGGCLIILLGVIGVAVVPLNYVDLFQGFARIVLGIWLVIITIGTASFTVVMLRDLLARTPTTSPRWRDLYRLRRTMRIVVVETILGEILFFFLFVTGRNATFNVALATEGLTRLMVIFGATQQLWVMGHATTSVSTTTGHYQGRQSRNTVVSVGGGIGKKSNQQQRQQPQSLLYPPTPLNNNNNTNNGNRTPTNNGNARAAWGITTHSSHSVGAALAAGNILIPVPLPPIVSVALAVVSASHGADNGNNGALTDRSLPTATTPASLLSTLASRTAVPTATNNVSASNIIVNDINNNNMTSTQPVTSTSPSRTTTMVTLAHGATPLLPPVPAALTSHSSIRTTTSPSAKYRSNDLE
jgi:hypothetical protein